MIDVLRWMRCLASFCLLVFFLFAAVNYETSVYLLHQARGQLSLILNTNSLSEYEKAEPLTPKEKANLQLIEEIKRYSVDSLGYKPTNSYTHIYNQQGKPILWVITGCASFSLTPYEWSFPLVGRVSYKGYFSKYLALKEYSRLIASGYDAELSHASAWSTLGWLSDPVLSSMLSLNKGQLCNLLFHELFHATYFGGSSVNFNENLANFIAHKATLRFLERDTLERNRYISNQEDRHLFNRYMLRKIADLKTQYVLMENLPDKQVLKQNLLLQIADSIAMLPLKNKEKYMARRQDILRFKNAYFVHFIQYDSMQDSLEAVFNKFYSGRLEKMVQHLKLD